MFVTAGPVNLRTRGRHRAKEVREAARHIGRLVVVHMQDCVPAIRYRFDAGRSITAITGPFRSNGDACVPRTSVKELGATISRTALDRRCAGGGLLFRSLSPASIWVSTTPIPSLGRVERCYHLHSIFSDVFRAGIYRGARNLATAAEGARPQQLGSFPSSWSRVRIPSLAPDTTPCRHRL